MNCTCAKGYSGTFCNVPNGCSLPCLNGFIDPNCKTCTCYPLTSWDPASGCSKCAMKCQNNGTGDSSCTFCQCSIGYIGEFCEINGIALNTKFTSSFNVTYALTNFQSFSSAFSADVAYAGLIDKSQVSVSTLKNSGNLNFYLYSAPYTKSSTLLTAQTNTTTNLTAVVVKLQGELSVSTSPLRTGMITGSIDTSYGIQYGASKDTSTNSGGSNNKTIIIAVVVVCVIAVVGIAIGIVYYRKKKQETESSLPLEDTLPYQPPDVSQVVKPPPPKKPAPKGYS